MRLKGIIGTGLVLACLGTFVMGLGTLFITDDHADVINHNVKIMSEIGDVVNDHEARLRQMEK
jgi:lipoprotein